jgi:predicted phosphate transport protein (TIGR00153 family)
MKLKLTPQKKEFFRLFEAASANAIEIAELLVELLDSYPNDGDQLISRIKEHEHEGDRLVQETVRLINKTFVTPFDRDDIHRLATRLDDICDHIDEAAADIRLFDIKQVPAKAREQAQVIVRAVTALDQAVRKLDGFKDVSEELARVNDCEDEGDLLAREAIAGLFRSASDPIAVMSWKEIHEQLEEALDACENASDVLEAIFVKNR